MYIYIHHQSYHSILLAPSLSPLSLWYVSLSLICILIYVYVYIYKRNTIIISSIQLPKSWQAMLGFGDDPQKREVGTVDLLMLEPMVEMTGETTWNASHGKKPSNCDIPWGFILIRNFFRSGLHWKKIGKKGWMSFTTFAKSKGCSLVSTASWDADAAEQHGLGMKKQPRSRAFSRELGWRWWRFLAQWSMLWFKQHWQMLIVMNMIWVFGLRDLDKSDCVLPSV